MFQWFHEFSHSGLQILLMVFLLHFFVNENAPALMHPPPSVIPSPFAIVDGQKYMLHQHDSVVSPDIMTSFCDVTWRHMTSWHHAVTSNDVITSHVRIKHWTLSPFGHKYMHHQHNLVVSSDIMTSFCDVTWHHMTSWRHAVTSYDVMLWRQMTS